MGILKDSPSGVISDDNISHTTIPTARGICPHARFGRKPYIIPLFNQKWNYSGSVLLTAGDTTVSALSLPGPRRLHTLM
jgi:hypothetical protein